MYKFYYNLYKNNLEIYQSKVNMGDANDMFFYETIEFDYASIKKIRKQIEETSSAQEIQNMDELIAEYEKLLAYVGNIKRTTFIQPKYDDLTTPYREKLEKIREDFNSSCADLTYVKMDAEELLECVTALRKTGKQDSRVEQEVNYLIHEIKNLIGEIQDELDQEAQESYLKNILLDY